MSLNFNLDLNLKQKFILKLRQFKDETKCILYSKSYIFN